MTAVSSSNNYNSFRENYFGKTNDAISLAIDTAKVGLSSVEIYYLAKGIKPDVLTKANFAVSSLASWNDVAQIYDKLEKGEKITDKLRLNTASDFSVPQGSQPIKANKNLGNSRIYCRNSRILFFWNSRFYFRNSRIPRAEILSSSWWMTKTSEF